MAEEGLDEGALLERPHARAPVERAAVELGARGVTARGDRAHRRAVAAERFDHLVRARVPEEYAGVSSGGGECAPVV